MSSSSSCSPAREKRSSCLKSLCTLLRLQRCSLTTLNVTSSRPRWRRLSGWVPKFTPTSASKPYELYSVTNSSILFSSMMKKEAPTTPRVKNSNEALSDRPVPPSYLHMLARVSARVYLRLTLHVMTLVFRYQSSSQDSAASSLTAEKTSHRQDRNPTPERLQPKANTSTTRRKRLVRQFSLWVHITSDYCSLEGHFTLGNRYSSEYLKEKQCYLRTLKNDI